MAGDWSEFKHSILAMARETAAFRSLKYAANSPTRVYADLVKLEKGMTRALEVLDKLDLAHHEGQDLELDPFNWPAVQAIQCGRYVLQPGETETDADATYPSRQIRDLTELRDAAKLAKAMFKVHRGNSGQRSEQAVRADWVGKNFVRRHREHFGRAPPMSNTGDEVDLLAEALECAGIPHDAAIGLAPDVMRRNIEAAALARGEKSHRHKSDRAK
jgi:hypothetical protein